MLRVDDDDDQFGYVADHEVNQENNQENKIYKS